MTKLFFSKVAIGFAAFFAGQAAHADIITSLDGSPVSTGDGFYAYTYRVSLQAGQLDPVTGEPAPAQFGTIYDFGPLVTTAGVMNNPGSPGTVFISKTGLLADNQSQFLFSFNGTNPAASTGTFSTIVADNPNLTNIRFTYVGSTGINVAGQPTTLGGNAITVAQSPSNLGTFTVYSPFGATNPALTYDGQTYKGSNNTLQVNQGSLTGPLVPVPVPVISAVPEAATWAMMILGMGMIGGVMRRRVRASEVNFDAKIKRIAGGAVA